MEYTHIDQEAVTESFLAQQAMKAEKQAFAEELEDSRLARLQSTGPPNAKAEVAKARAALKVAELRAKADTYRGVANVSQEQVAEVRAEHVRSWTASIEAEHAQHMALINLLDAEGVPSGDQRRRISEDALAVLESAHEVALEAEAEL